MADEYADYVEPRYARWRSPPRWLTYLRLAAGMGVVVWLVFWSVGMRLPVTVAVALLLVLTLALAVDLEVSRKSHSGYQCDVCLEQADAPQDIEHVEQIHRDWRGPG